MSVPTRESSTSKWPKVRRIWEIIDRLRDESGCPWDRKQTPESVQTYLVEEAHETAAAVRGGVAEEAAEELGDLLFMVLFLIYLYEERGDFRLEDVCDLICEKMIRRHPHVFGSATVSSSQEVRDNWEKIKAEEKVSGVKGSGGVPASLPSLMRAYRMISRLSQQEGSRWNNNQEAVASFADKSRQITEGFEQGISFTTETMGEILLDLVNLGRIKGYRAEDCLHDALSSLGLQGL